MGEERDLGELWKVVGPGFILEITFWLSLERLVWKVGAQGNGMWELRKGLLRVDTHTHTHIHSVQ